ncbi:alpha/beta hydrolase [Streptomyces sp. NBC_00249]|uniref:RBBP9/YdeN family alpha/beta hydrolase n=1 Tax=Streptomyces sp. NBC_00249 TaxID=2975690 RepID=UPI00224E43C2|nr:alpha/beta fold hydrolase [Streptomyces sp. NBC_00249]MCX5196660.1 alpha/beta hydrolase [Streptomyces sp. NBC_00249]
MSRIVIAHGYGMAPSEHWYPSVAEEFSGEGHEVRVPAFSESAAPDAGVWLKELAVQTEGASAGGTVLVGHSLGGVNVLRLLQRHDTAAEGAFAGVVFVASMSGEVGYDALAPFFSPEFDWARIRGAAREFRVLHAADDPVTGVRTPEHIMRFVRELGATATVTASGGHFPSTGESRLVLPDAVRLIREVL